MLRESSRWARRWGFDKNRVRRAQSPDYGTRGSQRVTPSRSRHAPLSDENCSRPSRHVMSHAPLSKALRYLNLLYPLFRFIISERVRYNFCSPFSSRFRGLIGSFDCPFDGFCNYLRHPAPKGKHQKNEGYASGSYVSHIRNPFRTGISSSHSIFYANGLAYMSTVVQDSQGKRQGRW